MAAAQKNHPLRLPATLPPISAAGAARRPPRWATRPPGGVAGRWEFTSEVSNLRVHIEYE